MSFLFLHLGFYFLFFFLFLFFILVWFFFGFFWRFNFLMISQIAYFLHDAGCQQLHPCLCHFLCVCICVWVCGCHLTHRTVTEITMIIMKFFSVVEGFFFCEMRWGGFAFCSSCSKVSTHDCVWREGGGISEVGTQAWSYFAYLYWHVQVDFLCPKMSAIHRQL